jgi:hypothetical protein
MAMRFRTSFKCCSICTIENSNPNSAGSNGWPALVLVEKALNVFLVGNGIVAWQQDGAAGESAFHSVQGRFGFAFRRFRAG